MGTLCRVNGQYREGSALQGEWTVRSGHILVGTHYSVNEQYRKEGKKITFWWAQFGTYCKMHGQQRDEGAYHTP